MKRPLILALIIGAVAWFCYDRWRPRRDWPGRPNPYVRGRWEP